MKIVKNITGRQRRHIRLRKQVVGQSERPRLSVRRSLKNIFVQVIDDSKGLTLLSASTVDKEFRQKFPYGGNVKAASALGGLVAQKARQKKIEKVVFDRGGYAYHGRIKAFAEAARKDGLEF